MDFLTLLCSIYVACVLFTLSRSIVDILHTLCPRWFSILEDTTNIFCAVVTKLRHSDTTRIWTILRFTIYMVLYKPYPILTWIPYLAYIFFVTSLQTKSTIFVWLYYFNSSKLETRRMGFSNFIRLQYVQAHTYCRKYKVHSNIVCRP